MLNTVVQALLVRHLLDDRVQRVLEVVLQLGGQRPAAPTAPPAARTAARAPSCRSPSPSGRAPSRSARVPPWSSLFAPPRAPSVLPSSSAVFFLVNSWIFAVAALPSAELRGDVTGCRCRRSSPPRGTASASAAAGRRGGLGGFCVAAGAGWVRRCRRRCGFCPAGGLGVPGGCASGRSGRRLAPNAANRRNIFIDSRHCQKTLSIVSYTTSCKLVPFSTAELAEWRTLRTSIPRRTGTCISSPAAGCCRARRRGSGSSRKSAGTARSAPA